jgi:phosphoribosylaminoimidazole-succinocarboxamide synthase
MEEMALSIYKMASQYAEERGIIIADVKFEFGLDEEGDVVLIDEVLTPDSSRFWDREKYVVGQSQDSYDKQDLRDWLVKANLKGKEGVKIPEDVARATAKRYQEAYERLVGVRLDE